jgi:hypothetical protein
MVISCVHLNLSSKLALKNSFSKPVWVLTVLNVQNRKTTIIYDRVKSGHFLHWKSLSKLPFSEPTELCNNIFIAQNCQNKIIEFVGGHNLKNLLIIK